MPIDSENRFHLLRRKTSSLRQAHDIIFLLALMYSTYHTHNTSSLSDSKKNLSYRKKDFTVLNNNGIQFTAGATRDEAGQRRSLFLSHGSKRRRRGHKFILKLAQLAFREDEAGSSTNCIPRASLLTVPFFPLALRFLSRAPVE